SRLDPSRARPRDVAAQNRRPAGASPAREDGRVPTDPPYDRPTAADLAAARDREIEDWLRPDLDVLVCGINPGLYSAAVGLPFANPGTRYWTAVYEAGLTDRG